MVDAVMNSADIAAALNDRPGDALGLSPVHDLAVIGNSIAAYGWPVSTTGNIIHGSEGFHFWAETLSRGLIRAPRSMSFAVSGAQLGAIADQAALAAETTADTVVIGPSVATNDLDAGTYDIGPLIGTIWSTLRAARKRVVAFLELPRGGSDGSGQTLTATGLARQAAANQWMRDNADAYGVILLDAGPDFVDPALAAYQPKAGVTHDGKHPSQNGQYLIGKRIAAALALILPPRDVLSWMSFSETVAAYDATYNPRGNLVKNPMMLGGSTNAGSWSTADSNVTGLTQTRSVVTQGGRRLQQFVVSGTPTAGEAQLGISQSLDAANLAPGDVIEGLAFVSVDAGSAGLKGVRAMYRNSITAGTVDAAAGGMTGSYTDTVGRMPSEAWEGVLRIPRYVIPADFSAPLVRAQLVFAQNQVAAATVRFSHFEVRKVA